MAKIGRNDPCPCGSGKKFKKCCLNKNKQHNMNYWDLEKQLRDINKNTRMCLAPKSFKNEGCSNFQNCHSVTKRTSLINIARKGHLYFYSSDTNILDASKSNIKPSLIGINDASTFSGFCNNHDNSIFENLEKKSFIYSNKQCTLLTYRTIVYELYKKIILNKKMDKIRCFYKDRVEIDDKGFQKGFKEIEFYKEKLDYMLENQNYENIMSFIIELKSPPPIMGCNCFLILEDFNGNILQEQSSTEPILDVMSFTSFSSDDKGFVVFSWLDICKRSAFPFIQSLENLSNELMTNALIRFFFEYCLNIYINPDWLDLKSDAIKNSLLGRMKYYFENNFNNASIKDDSVKYDEEWPIIATHKIGF